MHTSCQCLGQWVCYRQSHIDTPMDTPFLNLPLYKEMCVWNHVNSYYSWRSELQMCCYNRSSVVLKLYLPPKVPEWDFLVIMLVMWCLIAYAMNFTSVVELLIFNKWLFCTPIWDYLSCRQKYIIFKYMHGSTIFYIDLINNILYRSKGAHHFIKFYILLTQNWFKPSMNLFNL